MNDDILVSLGRQFVDFAVQKESLIRRVQELEKQLAEITKPKLEAMK
jgi:hypothetical protein